MPAWLVPWEAAVPALSHPRYSLGTPLQSTAQAAERLQAWMHRLIGLALRAAQSALPPLSTPQETGLGVQRSMHHQKLSTLHLLLYSCLICQRVNGCWSCFGCVYVLLARRSQNVS